MTITAQVDMTQKHTENFVISRLFDAPCSRVYEYWTKPEQMARWFGPKGVVIAKSQLDLRPGGTYHYCMRTPGGDMWGKFIYRELVTNKKLVFVNSFSDAAGGTTRHPFSPTWPLEMLSTITFEEKEGKTRLTICWAPLNASDQEVDTFDAGREGMKQGWNGSLDGLEEALRE